jgi:hypothetical protein
MLIDKLNLVIQSSKCQGQLSMYCGFAWQCLPHSAVSLHQLCFEVLQHPLCSHDFAPSDFNLFDTLRDALRGGHSGSDHELEAMDAWLVALLKTSPPPSDVHKFVQCWINCIKKQGEYVEKWYTCELFIDVMLILISTLHILSDFTL